MKRLIPMAVLALALGACVSTPARIGTEAVGPAYHAGGGQWREGGSLVILLRTFEHDGRVAFCGARTERSPAAIVTPYTDDVAEVGVLQIDGDWIHQGFDILPEARWRADMTGAQAHCFVTNRPWRAAYADAPPEVRIARLTFDHDDDSGAAVLFRQAPVPRPLP